MLRRERGPWPAETTRDARARGVVYHILADAWHLSDDTDVNYMMVAERA